MSVTVLLGVIVLALAAQNVVLSLALVRCSTQKAAQPRRKPDVAPRSAQVLSAPALTPKLPIPDNIRRAFASESEPWASEGLERHAHELYDALGDWGSVEQTLAQEGVLESA